MFNNIQPIVSINKALTLNVILDLVYLQYESTELDMWAYHSLVVVTLLLTYRHFSFALKVANVGEFFWYLAKTGNVLKNLENSYWMWMFINMSKCHKKVICINSGWNQSSKITLRRLFSYHFSSLEQSRDFLFLAVVS
jgi:hypothetical protein